MSEHVKDKKFVITGRLATFSRDEAIELIKNNGAVIQPMVTPKTDYLVKGYFQLDLFNEDKKTRKLVLAEQLISEGHPIMIISEHSFLEMMK